MRLFIVLTNLFGRSINRRMLDLKGAKRLIVLVL